MRGKEARRRAKAGWIGASWGEKLPRGAVVEEAQSQNKMGEGVRVVSCRMKLSGDELDEIEIELGHGESVAERLFERWLVGKTGGREKKKRVA